MMAAENKIKCECLVARSVVMFHIVQDATMSTWLNVMRPAAYHACAGDKRLNRFWSFVSSPLVKHQSANNEKNMST